LEEIGAYKNIKRFAGSSAGAMTAALLAVGYNSHEIEEFLSQDLSKIFLGKIAGINEIYLIGGTMDRNL
jgi:predicted acylesterase/phospholipase RssA